MALDVVWVRQFTPYLGTVVYAFAAILGLHLLKTFIGSWLYRRRSRIERRADKLLWIAPRQVRFRLTCETNAHPEDRLNLLSFSCENGRNGFHQNLAVEQ
jgi:hypothetical protein